MISWIPNLPLIYSNPRHRFFGGMKDLDVHPNSQVKFLRFCETKGVLIWSPLPRRGAELLMFYVSTCRCRFVCILLQVMATNVMGPALLTKACFFFDGLKTDWKKAWENSLMAASWWILGMFNKIKQRMDEILTPSAFFCRIDLRMSTVNLWRNRKQALYPQLRAASKEEPSKVQLPVRISANV